MDNTIYKTKVISDSDLIREAYYKEMYGTGGIQGTNILVMENYSKKPLIKGRRSNKVIAPGSAFTASKHFDMEPPVRFPSMNTYLGLDNSQPDGAVPTNIQKVVLFGVAKDGAFPESTEIRPVDYKRIPAIEDMIPFRYPATANDLSAAERNVYFGRKQLTNYVAYYFKAFDVDPVIYQAYTDGTPVDANLYTSTNVLEAETYAELRLKVTKDDCREFFAATLTPSEAKVNSIMLFDAWYTEINGIKYFQNIQPLTKLNIVNESLADATKGLDIVYHIYY